MRQSSVPRERAHTHAHAHARRIIPSKANNTVTIVDSGIGMTKVRSGCSCVGLQQVNG